MFYLLKDFHAKRKSYGKSGETATSSKLPPPFSVTAHEEASSEMTGQKQLEPVRLIIFLIIFFCMVGVQFVTSFF